MPISTEIRWLVSISLHTCVSDGCSVLFQKLPGFQVFLASTGCRNKNLGGVLLRLLFVAFEFYESRVVIYSPPYDYSFCPLCVFPRCQLASLGVGVSPRMVGMLKGRFLPLL